MRIHYDINEQSYEHIITRVYGKSTKINTLHKIDSTSLVFISNFLISLNT